MIGKREECLLFYEKISTDFNSDRKLKQQFKEKISFIQVWTGSVSERICWKYFPVCFLFQTC